MDNLTKPEELKQEENTKAMDEVADILSVDTDEETHSEESEEEMRAQYGAMDREELVSRFSDYLKADDLEALRLRAKIIKESFENITRRLENEALEAFLAAGGQQEDYEKKEDVLETKFRKLYSEYKEARQKFLEKQEQEKLDNLAKKEEVLEQLRSLLQSELSLKETYDSFNSIQEKWRAIGAVPRAEVNTLWENYHFLIEKFYDKVKISKELRDMGLKKNLEEKIALCERVEGLMLESSINKSFKQLQECHQLWKEIGPVPTDKNEEIWERFKNASDAVNKRRQEYYDKMREEQSNNYLAKIALCEKLEEVLKHECDNIKKWNDRTNEVNELFKLWKTIGPVPKAENESIWERFKKPIDDFYKRKKEAFDRMKSEQDVSLAKKTELCMRAEAIAERSDWKAATEELLKLQAEWKEVGYLPKKLSDKLWTRFRQACDRFFERKSEDYKARKSNELENVAKKEKLIEKVKAFSFGEDKQANLDAIKDFQRQWAEIGFVPSSERQRLYSEFRKAIDAHFDKLQADSMELSLNAFRERVEANPEDRKYFSKERKQLQDQLQKLRGDLMVWENNLGFLASSRQADLLRAEFEKKMERARADIALLQAKLKVLNESDNDKKEEKQ